MLVWTNLGTKGEVRFEGVRNAVEGSDFPYEFGPA